MNIALWGLFEFDEKWMTIVFGLIRSTILAIIWFLPFMLDRILYPKFSNKGARSTLIFPLLTTAIFFLSSLEGPFDDGSGTLSSFGHGYSTLVFTQVRSLLGIWILIFIHSWLFAIVNYLWENQFKWIKIKKIAITYLSVIVLTFLFGVVKTSLQFAPKSNTVKIAAVVLIPENGEVIPMSRIFDSRTTSPFEQTISRIERLTKKAVKGGAKIVSFQEFAMVINQVDESKLREHYKRIAKENNTYLSITYAYFSKEGKGENKHLFINGNGEILLDYTKRYLLGIGPFGEASVFKKGPEIIQSTKTPYGTIGISICRDMGFPSFIRQAAKDKVDIMLSPSYDWPKSPSAWYLTSTIENGFSFVRPTYNGYSYAADYNGKVLAHMDSDQSVEGIMYSDVPVKGIKVLYPVFGDVMGWLCVIVMIVLIGFRFLKKSSVYSDKAIPL
ncbi:carbon-nitrogen hydrolase family protein [Maribacter sp. HTCC2170]|uniref:carbon-nitrogen hydrolase family protein n=1 Tax=Maribacter sp. (strain HTCC2170 / KCCM 42371) TaxID=313603 RepID=UPI001305329D|nr:carbon-nitrogen hydrolase family protein [Maribacter sp. HTCC2170]